MRGKADWETKGTQGHAATTLGQPDVDYPPSVPSQQQVPYSPTTSRPAPTIQQVPRACEQNLSPAPSLRAASRASHPVQTEHRPSPDAAARKPSQILHHSKPTPVPAQTLVTLLPLGQAPSETTASTWPHGRAGSTDQRLGGHPRALSESRLQASWEGLPQAIPHLCLVPGGWDFPPTPPATAASCNRA